MEIAAYKNEGAFIVSVKGRMDALTAPEFDRKFAGWMEAGETKYVINFHGLQYISSAGLRSILAAAKQVKAKNGKLVFTGVEGPVRDVFDLSGFFTLFQVVDSEEAALGRLR